MFVLKEWRMDELPGDRALMSVRPVGLTEASAKDAVNARIEELTAKGCSISPMCALRNGYVVIGKQGQVVGMIIDETPDPGTLAQRLIFAVQAALRRIGAI